MAGKITMMSTLIMLIFLSVFLYSGLEKVKAADTEDTIMFPIDGILCHQQAGELFDEINEERAKRGISHQRQSSKKPSPIASSTSPTTKKAWGSCLFTISLI